MTVGDEYFNPGNIKWGPFAQSTGALGPGRGGHAIYPDYETGRRALERLLTTKGGGQSIGQIGSWYAEDPDWGQGVANVLGVSPGWTARSASDISRLADAVQRQEGTRIGGVAGPIASLGGVPIGGAGTPPFAYSDNNYGMLRAWAALGPQTQGPTAAQQVLAHPQGADPGAVYRQPQQQFNPLTMLRSLYPSPYIEGRQEGGEVLPGQTVLTGERGRELVITPRGVEVVGSMGPELITPREGAQVVPQAPVSPARAAGTALKGIGGFMAPSMTSLGTGEVPPPTPWPTTGPPGKVPEADPRWGAVPIEAAGFLEPPARLGAMAMAGLGAAMRRAPKSLLDMIPGTQAFKAGEPLLTHIGGRPVAPFKPPEDWSTVAGQNHNLNELDLVAPPGKKLASGLVMVEPDGRVWLAKPKGGYGGYEHTWPKGRLEEGLHPQANAIKEAFEETGLRGDIIAHLGDYEGDTTLTRYYLAKRAEGVPQHHGWESEAVLLAHPEDLPKLLNKQRDRTIAADMIGHEEHPWNKPKGPPAPTPESIKATEAAVGPDYFPMAHWKQTGPQKGSNPGGTYTTTAGQDWYVKFPQSEDHARNEQLTNELYRLTGANVPHTMLVRGPDGKVGIASHMLPAGSPTFADIAATGADHSSYHPHLHDHFATDAWLANRDVLGLTNDNIMVNSDTNLPVRIDQGGGLRYRAMGDPKTDFGPKISEWDYMLNKGKAKAVFGSMSPQKQVESIDRVLAVDPNKIAEAIDRYGPKDWNKGQSLFSTLMDRREHLRDIRDGIIKGSPPPQVTPELEAGMKGLLAKPKAAEAQAKPQFTWEAQPKDAGYVYHSLKGPGGKFLGGIGDFGSAGNKTYYYAPASGGLTQQFGTLAEAKAAAEAAHEAKPAPVTFGRTAASGDHFAFTSGPEGTKKIAEITHLGREHPTHPDMYMVEPMGNGAPTFHDTLAGAKVHVQQNHPSWELPPRPEPKPEPPKPQTKPVLGSGYTPGKTDIAAAEKKGHSAGDPLSYRETKDLYYHHGGEHLEKAPYADPTQAKPRGGWKRTAAGPEPLVHDPKEIIPAEKGALQTMMTRWLQPTEHAAARGASPFQTAAFRGVRKPPREFPTPGSDLNAYYSTSDPGLAMRYAIGEGNRPESISWMGATPTTGPRLQHLLLDTRNYLHVDAEGRNWTEIHQAAANEAARRGKHGVVINRTYDEPSQQPKPGQAPVTVFLTFRPGMHTVRSAAARFDPTHFGKVGLKYGVAGALPAGMATAYSHGPAPEEYHEPNALGAR